MLQEIDRSTESRIADWNAGDTPLIARHASPSLGPFPPEVWHEVLRQVYDLRHEEPLGSRSVSAHRPLQSLRLASRELCRMTDVHATIAELRHAAGPLPEATFDKLLWRFLDDGLQTGQPAPAGSPDFWRGVAPASTTTAALGLAALGHSAARANADALSIREEAQELDADEDVENVDVPYDTSHFDRLLRAAASFEPADRARALAGPISLYCVVEDDVPWAHSQRWQDLRAAIEGLPMTVPGRPDEFPRAEVAAFLAKRLDANVPLGDPRVELALGLLFAQARALGSPPAPQGVAPQKILLGAAAELIALTYSGDHYQLLVRLADGLPGGDPRAEVMAALAHTVGGMLASYSELGPPAFARCLGDGRRDNTGRVLSALLEGFGGVHDPRPSSLLNFALRREVAAPTNWQQTVLAVEDALDPACTPESPARCRLVSSLFDCASRMSDIDTSWSAGLQQLAMTALLSLEPEDQRKGLAVWADAAGSMVPREQVDRVARAWDTASQGDADQHVAVRRLIAHEAMRFGAGTVDRILEKLGIADRDTFLAGGVQRPTGSASEPMNTQL